MRRLTHILPTFALLIGFSVQAEPFFEAQFIFDPMMGDNEIVVTAADLQIGQEYLIDWYVAYHTNPRTPPPEGSIQPPTIEYTGIAFVAEQTEHTVTLASHLPDCHWPRACPGRG